MNIIIKSFLSIFAVILFALVFGTQIRAQENPSANSNAESATPVPIPTPIPIGDVVTQAEETSRKLEKIKEGLKNSPGISVIEVELPKLKNVLDERVLETNELMSARPTLETLRTVEQEWAALAKNAPVWKDDLKSQITVYDNFVKELTGLKELWQKTLDALETPSSLNENIRNRSNSSSQSASSNANTNAPESAEADVPPVVLAKINDELLKIDQVQKQIEEKRRQLLTLQAQVGTEETRIKDALVSIKKYREEALTNLLTRDSPAIWNAHRRTDSIGGIASEAKNSYAAQIGGLTEYAAGRSDKFLIHGAIFLLFTLVLFRARKRLRPMVEEDPELKPAFSAFELPFVGALILAIMLSGYFYPQAPRILSAMLGAAALIPGIIYLRRILEKPLFPILNALMVFYFIDQLRQITATLPLITRFLFIAEMLGAIIFLIWFLRSKSLSKKIEVKHQRIFIVIRKVIPYLLVLFAVAFLASVLGYVSLANVVGGSVLGSSYIALILYTAIQIVKSLIIFALRVPPLSNLGMVKSHRDMLKRMIFRGLKWLGIAFWGLLTLDLFSVRQSLFDFVKGWLTAELTIGSIAISLGDLIAFGITVWLAFLLSRAVRFILDEDVYPRVNLAGGVPYAISTMLHYAILVAGFVLALAALGLDLTKFTILAGAFGVGLGFGLQNIVNNFVSGLILLFERPVKVNDVIQVGERQGDLKRIGLRASVLRTLDGSEVIVPNGQLISEEVTNWTFSDQQRRLEVNVGVAYGSNPHEVMEMLTKVALDNTDILDEPAPRTIFVGFGESSLDFQLRGWTDKADRWVIVRSDLTLAIHDVLKKAGIEIPFPQRDLNIRSKDQSLPKKQEE